MYENSQIYAVTFDDGEYNFISCISCKIYLMKSRSEFLSWIQNELGDIDIEVNLISVTCVNCIGKETLTRENFVLKDDIQYLNGSFLLEKYQGWRR